MSRPRVDDETCRRQARHIGVRVVGVAASRCRCAQPASRPDLGRNPRDRAVAMRSSVSVTGGRANGWNFRSLDRDRQVGRAPRAAPGCLSRTSVSHHGAGKQRIERELLAVRKPARGVRNHRGGRSGAGVEYGNPAAAEQPLRPPVTSRLHIEHANVHRDLACRSITVDEAERSGAMGDRSSRRARIAPEMKSRHGSSPPAQCRY